MSLSAARWVVVILALLTCAAAPLAVSAQSNICPKANATCSTPDSVHQAKQCTCVIAAYIVVGKCTAPEQCTGVTWGLASGGVAGATNAISSLPPSLDSVLNPGFFDNVGTFIGKNPLVSMIGLTAGTQLLSTLLTSSRSSSGSSGGSGYNSTFCTGQQYYSANPNPNDPCAVYSPTGGSGQSLPTSGASDTSISDLLNSLQNQNAGGATSSQSNSINDLLNTSGSDVVTASTTPNGTTCSDGSFCASGYYCSSLQAGQCIPSGKVDCGAYWCEEGNTCSSDSSMQCISSSSNISNQNLYANDTSSSTPSASQTDLNQKNIPVPANGLHGDLLSFGGGATIYGQSVSGGTTVSGFYGSQGGAAGLCASRPWASNFLSYIIPPGFFDSLCSFGGYPTGPAVSVGSSGGISQNTVTVIGGPGAPATPSLGAQSAVAPQAAIGASPPSVNLGGRTTVFWTSRNVASCEESSSDGNFHGTSASGGASTVALSGPVTFYIACLGLDGTKVTNSYTVQIGI